MAQHKVGLLRVETWGLGHPGWSYRDLGTTAACQTSSHNTELAQVRDLANSVRKLRATSASRVSAMAFQILCLAAGMLTPNVVIWYVCSKVFELMGFV